MYDREVPSPNFGYPTGSKDRNGYGIKKIVVHVTDGNNSEDWTANPESNVSYNYIIKKSGEILLIVDDAKAPYSNGVIRNPKVDLDTNVNPNLYSLTIAREGFSYENPTDEQWESLVKLIAEKLLQYELEVSEDIWGHFHIDSVERINCPSLDMQELENAVKDKLLKLKLKRGKSMSKYFNDIHEEWLAEAVDALHQKGIVNGRSATEFDPNGQITRGEAAVLIHRTIEYLKGGK